MIHFRILFLGTSIPQLNVERHTYAKLRNLIGTVYSDQKSDFKNVGWTKLLCRGTGTKLIALHVLGHPSICLNF